MRTRLQIRHRGDPPSRKRNAGFTLAELLTVLAIIGLLSVLAIAGFNQIGASKGVTEAASTIETMFEFARSEAVAKQTFVWVALAPVPRDGSLEIVTQALYSADGSPSPTTANLIPLTKQMKVRLTTLVTFAALKQSTRDLSGTATVTELTQNATGIPQTSLPPGMPGAVTVTFTPRGEAMLKAAPAAGDGFDPLIGVGVIPAKGTTPMTGSPDDAAVLIDGGTGQSIMLRL